MRTFPALAALVAVAAIGFTVIDRHVEHAGVSTADGVECAEISECADLVECACSVPSHDAVDELGELMLPASGTAEAAPTLAVQLTSLDAGSTQTFQITAKRCYCLQPTGDATAVHFDTWDGGSLAASYSKDLALNTGTLYSTSMLGGIANHGTPFCFDSANQTAISAIQADGGAVNANLFLMNTNPTSPAYNCSTQLRSLAN